MRPNDIRTIIFLECIEKKTNFCISQKSSGPKYDIFKVHRAFTVMQGPNFRKENQKKRKTY